MMDSRAGQPGFAAVMAYITPHKNTLTLIVALLMLNSALSLAGPWIAGLLTHSVLAQDTTGITPPWQLLALWLMLSVVRALINVVSRYQIGYTGERMTRELRYHLYEHLQALPLGFHHRNSRGDTLTTLYTDTERVSNFVTDTLVHLLPSVLVFLGATAALIWFSPLIALLALLFLPLYFLCMKILGRGLRPSSRAWMDANARLYSVLEENLRMMPTIKAFTREQIEQGNFDRANKDLLKVTQTQLRLQSILSPATSLLGSVALVAIIALGATLVDTGQLSAPELVTILLYTMMMMSPLGTLADTYGRVQVVRGATERIIEFLGTQPEPDDQDKTPLKDIRGNIKIENLAFSYPGRPPVFAKLCLSIEAGETIALTGHNGAGKSTLAQLLMGFEQPAQGRILYDGTDIAEATLASLRTCVGLVAQRVLLVNGSIAANITYGRPDATKQELERVARLARAHDFIEALPEGYDTVIGDEGIRLSGGQQQRLSLARTLLRDPPILILDEATAMFDPAGEDAFIEDCREVLNGRTVVLITHRPAILSLADRVLSIENGELLETSQ